MMTNRLLTVGIIGTAAAALCCFTPLLPVVLGGLGLSGLVGYVYRDAVLIPLAIFFLTLTGFALWRRKRAK